MNEQIKLLAEAAGLQWKVPAPHFTNTDNPIDFPKNPNVELEKFAELLVQECVRIGHLAFLKDNSKVPVFPAKKIKDHFGVSI